jgi:multimeric flavodoxin WrbA
LDRLRRIVERLQTGNLAMTPVDVRKGMPSVELSREEFEKRYRSRFVDPAFEPLQRELDAITAAAWDAYSNSRKSPHTRKAGPGFADPDYDLSLDWLAAREAILAAQRRHDDAGETPRILLINGSSRSDQTCPGEMSKTWRLVKIAEPVFREMGFAVDILDLSRLASEFGRQIHPCKACVSTSEPLCHWPCSCYPNYALGQTNDWMNEIYPLWIAAHGIMIVTPVNWYHAPTGLKAMIDRLVCADGGNPDPSSTHGKNPEEAKALELKGWPYPRHLDGRHFAVVVHGDAAGAETLRRTLSDWLTDMSLVQASRTAEVDGYIGYMEPYATSHQALDQDEAFQQQTRNAARALGNAVNLSRAGKYQRPDEDIEDPNPK